MFLRRTGRGNRPRFAFSGIAAVQIAVAAALVPADAVLDIDLFGLPEHVESPAADCPVHYGHLFCQIVRSLWVPGAAQRVTIAPEDAPTIHVAHPGHESCVPISASIWSASLIPRAPPLG